MGDMVYAAVLVEFAVGTNAAAPMELGDKVEWLDAPVGPGGEVFGDDSEVVDDMELAREEATNDGPPAILF
jgi:hypothetical protein